MVSIPAFSFRFKILLLVVAILAGAVGITLVVTQRRLQMIYQKLFSRQYESQIEFFRRMQEVRLGHVRSQCLGLAANDTFLSAARAGDRGALLRLARQELLDLFPAPRQRSVRSPLPDNRPIIRGAYFRIFGAGGEELLESGLVPRQHRVPAEVVNHFKTLLAESAVQQVGYFTADSEEGGRNLFEVIITPLADPDSGESLGAMVIGFVVIDFGERMLQQTSQIQSGIILENEVHSRSIPITVRPALLAGLAQAAGGWPESTASFDLEIHNEPHRCFVRALNPGSVFPTAWHVSLYSLADQFQDLRQLRLRVAGFGLVVFFGALILAWLLTHGLAVPLRELVAGTHEIERGNYHYAVPVRSRDEIGRLAESFNEMAQGLAQRDKYAVVLRQVADQAVAEKLMSGDARLGGERRRVTVLFCDIRGFTALTQNLPPEAVVGLLNEHMTLMTRLVYQHHGVVDKFVGDLIMAVFGAPAGHGNDAEDAARCALRMVAERHELNEAGGQKIAVGIGLATGDVLAGCMGSEDRLNYTVLGERVNLASRLCDVAGRMDVVIDDVTRAALGGAAAVQPIAELRLKGFPEPIRAFRLVSLK